MATAQQPNSPTAQQQPQVQQASFISWSASAVGCLLLMAGLSKIEALIQCFGFVVDALWSRLSLFQGSHWVAGFVAALCIWECSLAIILLLRPFSLSGLVVATCTFAMFVAYLVWSLITGSHTCPCLGDQFSIGSGKMLVADLLVFSLLFALVVMRFRIGPTLLYRTPSAVVICTLLVLVGGYALTAIATLPICVAVTGKETSSANPNRIIYRIAMKNYGFSPITIVGSPIGCSSHVLDFQPVVLVAGESVEMKVDMPAKKNMFRKFTIPFLTQESGLLKQRQLMFFD